MSSPQAAPRAAASKPAAPRTAAPKALVASLAAMLSPARAEASRRNGAKSRGPKTTEGKARSAQNALRHGLRAQKHVVLPDEDAAEFAALEAAIVEDLAPAGALQMALAQRVVAATWRLARAERIESELFAIQGENPVRGWGRLGLAVIRDCNGAGAFGTLLRYRGGTLAELSRALRTLKALQAERHTVPEPARSAAPVLVDAAERALRIRPNEPEASKRPGESQCATGSAPIAPGLEAPVPAPARPAAVAPRPAPSPRVAPRAIEKQPDEPESPDNPCDSDRPTPLSNGAVARNGSASLLAGTALVPIGRRNGS